MSSYLWFQFGRYAGIVLAAGVMWLTRRRGFWRVWPHRHTGYVSLSGRAWSCRKCGKLPAPLPAPLPRCTSCGQDIAPDTGTHGYCAGCWNMIGPVITGR